MIHMYLRLCNRLGGDTQADNKQTNKQTLPLAHFLEENGTTSKRKLQRVRTASGLIVIYCL